MKCYCTCPADIVTMKVRLGLAVILLSFFMLMTPALSASSAVTGSVSANTTWTIMVYMADDYPVVLSWQDDINEMEAAQQAPGTNIIALIDQYGVGDSFLLKVARDPNFLNDTIVSPQIDDGGAVITGGEVDMSSPSTLSAFITFCEANYPADRLVLILWGHGASWRGLCPDGSGLLTLPELGTGLSDAVSAVGRSLDMVVVDSCAEASLEMFAQLRGYTTIFVGSEKDVPYQGLPYVLLMNDLAAAPSQGPVRFGTSITNDYVTWSATNSDYSTTMGVFNMTKTNALLMDLSDLSAAGARYDQLFHTTMRDSVNSSEQYEEPFRVDFGDLMGRLSSADLPLEVKYFAIQCTLDAERMVEHFMKYSNLYSTDGILVTNATGLTVYPASAESSDALYADLAIAGTPWEDFGRHLRNSTITIANQPGPSVNITPTALANPSESWPWTKAKLSWPESYEEVAAVVFRQEGDGLVYVSNDRSSGTTLELRIPGILTVAASADIGDQAVSYHLLNFTLGGRDSLRVLLTKEGEPIQQILGSYDVRITTTNGSTLMGGYSPSLGNGTYVCSIDIPREADIGDRLNIEVRDSDSGTLVGRVTTTVGTDVTHVLIPIVDHEESSTSMIVPTIFAALPGILVLCFAILMYMQQRKKPRMRH
jgi:hypothetical protein